MTADDIRACRDAAQAAYLKALAKPKQYSIQGQRGVGRGVQEKDPDVLRKELDLWEGRLRRALAGGGISRRNGIPT